MAMEDWFHFDEREYDVQMEEESYGLRVDAINQGMIKLLQSIKDLYPDDRTDSKVARCKLLVEQMKTLYQVIEGEYGKTLPQWVEDTIIVEVFNLSSRENGESEKG